MEGTTTRKAPAARAKAKATAKNATAAETAVGTATKRATKKGEPTVARTKATACTPTAAALPRKRMQAIRAMAQWM